jgi:hypothetical protein
LTLLLSLSCFSLYAQTETEKVALYIIDNYEYEIEGMSRPWAIENYLNAPETAEFSDLESMMIFAGKLKQDLINLRIFETVEMEFIRSEHDEEEISSHYTLKFSVKDGWTFFPLLIPIFDSNDNFSLQLKINYANFFGTLVDFNIDGDFGIAVDPVTEDLGVNFWNVETSFSNINFKRMAFTFSWNQAYARDIKKDGIEILEYYTYNKSEFYIATNFDLGSDYYYELAPTFELTYNYQDRTGFGDSYIDKEPQSYGIYQKGGRDQVNWIGNFQEGNHWETELISRIVPGDGFKGELLFTNRWFTLLNHNMAYGNRVLAFTAIRDEIYELGKYMRGVPDFNLSGGHGMFLNNSLSISVFKWKNVMEAQIQPFSDIGIVSPSDRNFSAKNDMRMTLGCDFIIFPEKLTAVNLRTTVGFDLFGPGDLSERYEILLSTSLFF